MLQSIYWPSLLGMRTLCYSSQIGIIIHIFSNINIRSILSPKICLCFIISSMKCIYMARMNARTKFILVYRYELGSSIHPNHIDAYHRGNYEAQTNFWAQNGSNIDIRDYMNYDPYLGRITENSAAQQ